jgi:hypothetical protein
VWREYQCGDVFFSCKKPLRKKRWFYDYIPTALKNTPKIFARVFGALDHHTRVDLEKKNRSSSKWGFDLSIRGFFSKTVKKTSYRAD